MRSLAEDGYATPLAMVLALGLALIAAGVVQRSVALLRLSRADLTRTQLAYALNGAELDAVAAVIRSGPGGPYRWALSTDAGWTEAIAEPEASKLGLTAASRLDDRSFAAFGVADVADLKVRLVAAARGPALVDIGLLDSAPLWRACAASVFSSLGTATAVAPPAVQTPHMESLTPAWRVGEVWRIQVTTSTGWRDERIVRLTGDALHPAATVLRSLRGGQGGQAQCDAIIAAAA
jgi:hypothetical protein